MQYPSREVVLFMDYNPMEAPDKAKYHATNLPFPRKPGTSRVRIMFTIFGSDLQGNPPTVSARGVTVDMAEDVSTAPAPKRRGRPPKAARETLVKPVDADLNVPIAGTLKGFRDGGAPRKIKYTKEEAVAMRAK